MHQPTPRARAWPLAGLLLLTSLASHAAPDGDTLMQKGGANPAAMPCISCHAPDGKGMAAAGFPRLAGLPADYIRKQLHDFKAGRRQNGVMQPIATALTEEEIDALAGAYAARPRVNVAPQPVGTPPEGSGAWIALRGAWDRSIPECTLCHGPGGIGVDPSFPPLAGQGAVYIENQLKAWRGTPAVKAHGKTRAVAAVPPTRQNDPNGLMQHIAASLTPTEMKAVAEYFGSLGDSSEPFDDTQHRLR
ncbi:c-type cytochrome [Ideonella dechloratans]|uniref:c-type cytochrome n=1 Tax=Ideonella dechloratans TaxID=36863 RepID=UPI0035B1EC16